VKPSDEQFESEIVRILRSNGATSAESGMGVYAVYTRIKEARKTWMLAPMRVKASLDELTKKGNVEESIRSRKYYLSD